jgi:hypothetical protein
MHEGLQEWWMAHSPLHPKDQAWARLVWCMGKGMQELEPEGIHICGLCGQHVTHLQTHRVAQCVAMHRRLPALMYEIKRILANKADKEDILMNGPDCTVMHAKEQRLTVLWAGPHQWGQAVALPEVWPLGHAGHVPARILNKLEDMGIKATIKTPQEIMTAVAECAWPVARAHDEGMPRDVKKEMHAEEWVRARAAAGRPIRSIGNPGSWCPASIVHLAGIMTHEAIFCMETTETTQADRQQWGSWGCGGVILTTAAQHERQKIMTWAENMAERAHTAVAMVASLTGGDQTPHEGTRIQGGHGMPDTLVIRWVPGDVEQCYPSQATWSDALRGWVKARGRK